MRLYRSLRHLWLMAMLLVVLAACDTGEDGPTGETEADASMSGMSADVVELSSHGSVDGGDDDTRSGTLVADVDTGCVWIDGPAGREPVLWPPGWRLDPAAETILDDTGEVAAALGEPVLLHGGSNDGYVDRLPDDCLTGEPPFLVNPLDGGILDR